MDAGQSENSQEEHSVKSTEDHSTLIGAKDKSAPAAVYLRAWISYLLSHARLRSAQVVFLKLQERLATDNDLASSLGDARLPGVEERNFEYVCSAGFLMYATAIFDSFLSDTTKFLLLSKPDALGQSCVVPIGTLTSSKSRAAILNKEIGRKVRALSTRSSVEDRIKFLCRNFGIMYHPDEVEMQSLRDTWELRNEVAHDQSIFGFELDDTQQNRIVPKGAHPVAPSRLSFKIGSKAVGLHMKIAYGIYRSVLKDFLNVPDEEMSALSADGEDPLPSRGLMSEQSVEMIRAIYGAGAPQENL